MSNVWLSGSPSSFKTYFVTGRGQEMPLISAQRNCLIKGPFFVHDVMETKQVYISSDLLGNEHVTSTRLHHI